MKNVEVWSNLTLQKYLIINPKGYARMMLWLGVNTRAPDPDGPGWKNYCNKVRERMYPT